jgi:ATP-binding cassette subfamily B protein
MDQLFKISLLWKFLDKGRKIQLLAVLLLIFLSSLAEISSIAIIVPYISILSDIDSFRIDYPLFMAWIDSIDSYGPQFVITAVFIFLVLVAALIKLIYIRSSILVAHGIGRDLSRLCYSNLISQELEFFQVNNSSELFNTVLKRTTEVVGQIIVPVLSILSTLIFIVAVVFGLIYMGQMVSILALVLIGVCYLVVGIFVRQALLKKSIEIGENGTTVIHYLNVGISGIREIILSSSRRFFIDKYGAADENLRRAQAEVQIVGQYPRSIVEALAIATLLIVTFLSFRNGVSDVSGLSVLALLALTGHKLLPLIQQSFMGWTTIKGGSVALNFVLKILALKKFNDVSMDDGDDFSTLELVDVTYRYPNSNKDTLLNINLVINKGDRLGVKGRSGSGKSTLLDIISGLKMPTSGSIKVNGRTLNLTSIASIRRYVGLLSQGTYLMKGSIVENIAFGVDTSSVDIEKVLSSIDQSHSREFIRNDNIFSFEGVSENGGNLSGGQKQRLGIARALYFDKDVLLFDEATSALDNKTEQEVIKAIDSLDKSKTIIVSAHRLTTLDTCNRIIEMSEGQLISNDE